MVLDDDLAEADHQILSAREAFHRKKEQRKPIKIKKRRQIEEEVYEPDPVDFQRKSADPFQTEYSDWTIGSRAEEEYVEEDNANVEAADYGAPLEKLPDDYAGWTIGSRADEVPYVESETMRDKRKEIILPKIPTSRYRKTSEVGKKKKKKKKPKHKQQQEKVPGFRGVHCRTALDGGKKYFSLVSIKGKKTYLGSFDTPEECAFEYDKLVLSARDHVPRNKLNYPDRHPLYFE